MVLDDSGPRLSSRSSTMSNPTAAASAAAAAAGTSNPPTADDSGELEPTFDTFALHCLPLLLLRLSWWPRRASPHVESFSDHVQSHPCCVRFSPVLLDISVLHSADHLMHLCSSFYNYCKHQDTDRQLSSQDGQASSTRLRNLPALLRSSGTSETPREVSHQGEAL